MAFFIISIVLVCCSTIIIARSEVNSQQQHIGLPVETGNYDFDFVRNFTKYLHNIHRFSSFVTFREINERKRPPHILVRSLEQALMEDFKVPVIVWGTNPTAKLRNIIGLNSMAFVYITSIEDPMLNVVDNTLESLHFMTMLFIYKRQDNRPLNKMKIEEFFQWCWHRNIVNVALTSPFIRRERNKGTRQIVTVQNQVYNYTPFPHLTVFNLTDKLIQSRETFLIDKISNVRGFNFMTYIFLDPPTVFLTPFVQHPHHAGESLMSITGTAGHLFHEYIHRINGTIDIIALKETVNFFTHHKQALLLAANKIIHIGIHPFSNLLTAANETEGSYPIAQTNVCIIVPLVAEIDISYYLARPFQPSIWAVVLVMFVMLIILQFFSHHELLLNLFGFGRALLFAFATLLVQPLTETAVRRRMARYRFFHFYTFMFCYILSSVYNASLTSLLSTTVLGNQIISVDDFMESGLEILLLQYEKDHYFDNDDLPTSLNSRLRVVDKETLEAHRDRLNTSYAYVVTKEKWQMLNLQQTRLWKPRFRIASNELCTPMYFVKFPVQWDSPFTLSLALFFMAAQESGLSRKWEEMSIYQAIEMELIKIIADHPQNPKPLNIAHYSLLIKIWFSMWSLSVICFLSELMWHHWKEYRQAGVDNNLHLYNIRKQI